MLNKYPLWKYLLVVSIVALGLFYSAPNLYVPDPALQITGESSSQRIDDKILGQALGALDEAGIEHFDAVVDPSGRTALVRLRDKEQQLPAQARVSRVLGDGFIVALNLAPNPFALSEIVLWLNGALTDRSWREVMIAAPLALTNTCVASTGSIMPSSRTRAARAGGLRNSGSIARTAGASIRRIS